MNQDRISHSAVKAYLFVLLWFATDTWTAFLVAFLAVLVLTMLDVFIWAVVDELSERRSAVARATSDFPPPIDPGLAHLEPAIAARHRGLDLARRIRQSRASR